jgi:hypothetical protein
MTSTTFKLPTLWTEDDVAAQCLTECFRIGLPGSEGEGEHILAMQSELEIRVLARKIQSAGGKVKVFPAILHYPFRSPPWG